MVKITNRFGDVKTGKQDKVVYQRHYSNQTRRTLREKKDEHTRGQLEQRDRFRTGIYFAKNLTKAQRDFIKSYMAEAGIRSPDGLPTTWYTFAKKIAMTRPKVEMETEAGSGFSGTYADWIYRKPITVNNTSGGECTNYPVLITLTTENFPYSHCKSDGSDIRFSQDDGTTPLSYMIKDWNYNGISKLLVKVDSIPTGQNIPLYLYYGNTEATSESNGFNTYNLFDDFNDNSLTGWTWEEGVAGNQAVEQNQRLEITNALNSYGHVEKSGLPDTFLAQVKIYRPSLPNDQTWAPGLVIWFNAKDWANIVLAGSGSEFTAHRVINDSNFSTSGGSFSAGTWYWLRIKSDGTNIYFEYSTNGTDWTTLSNIAVPATWIIDANSLVELGSGYEQGATYPNPKLNNNYSSPGANWTAYFDDFRVRKYVTPEPSVSSMGEEETGEGEKTLKALKIKHTAIKSFKVMNGENIVTSIEDISNLEDHISTVVTKNNLDLAASKIVVKTLANQEYEFAVK
jgi:hypothetical protein